MLAMQKENECKICKAVFARKSKAGLRQAFCGAKYSFFTITTVSYRWSASI